MNAQTVTVIHTWIQTTSTRRYQKSTNNSHKEFELEEALALGNVDSAINRFDVQSDIFLLLTMRDIIQSMGNKKNPRHG